MVPINISDDHEYVSRLPADMLVFTNRREVIKLQPIWCVYWYEANARRVLPILSYCPYWIWNLLR